MHAMLGRPCQPLHADCLCLQASNMVETRLRCQVSKRRRACRPADGLRETVGRAELPAEERVARPLPASEASSTTWKRPRRLAAAFSGSEADMSADVLLSNSRSAPPELSLQHACRLGPGRLAVMHNLGWLCSSARMRKATWGYEAYVYILLLMGTVRLHARQR